MPEDKYKLLRCSKNRHPVIEMVYTLNLDMIYDHYWDSPIVPPDLDRLPFINFETHYGDIIRKFQLTGGDTKSISTKIENMCKKILMMYCGGRLALECEKEFMSTQNRCMPALIWDYEVKILYHLEAMILFGRSSLDISTYVFAKLLLKSRKDSFNDFRKSLIRDSESKLLPLKEIISSNQSDVTSWLNIVCSNGESRSERDKIAHQAIIKIRYLPVAPESERVYCHVCINGKAIPLENFIKEVCAGVSHFCMSAEDIIIDQCV